MAEAKKFPDGLNIVKVQVRDEIFESGEVFVRLAPRGTSEFAVFYLEMGDQQITALNDPMAGEFMVEAGFKEYEWKLDDR